MGRGEYVMAKCRIIHRCYLAFGREFAQGAVPAGQPKGDPAPRTAPGAFVGRVQGASLQDLHRGAVPASPSRGGSGAEDGAGSVCWEGAGSRVAPGQIWPYDHWRRLSSKTMPRIPARTLPAKIRLAIRGERARARKARQPRTRAAICMANTARLELHPNCKRR